MKIPPDTCCSGAGYSEHQQGVYAVEFGLTFLIFFLVLYAILTYGMIFIAQQSLSLAAQDGARAGLASQVSLQKRRDTATTDAYKKIAWLENMGGLGSVQVDACPNSTILDVHCLPGELKVVTQYNYRLFPLVPMLGPDGLMGLMVPATLRSEASVNLGIATGEGLD